MIRIKIFINDRVIGDFHAVNVANLEEKIGEEVIGLKDYDIYETSNGSLVLHRPKDGALVLSQKILEKLEEGDLTTTPEAKNDSSRLAVTKAFEKSRDKKAKWEGK